MSAPASPPAPLPSPPPSSQSITQRLYNMLHSTTTYYNHNPALSLDTDHALQFIEANKSAGRIPPASENQYIVDCMDDTRGINTAILMAGGTLGIPISHFVFRGNKVMGFFAPMLCALLSFAAVGTYRLQKCQVAMIEQSNTPIALDYRRRLAKQQPTHPLIQYHNKLQQQQSQSQSASNIHFVADVSQQHR